MAHFGSGMRNTLGSSSSVSAASLYIKLLMSRCDRRRRPLDGEQLFKFDVEVVQVVDEVNVEVKVVVAIVTVKVVKKSRFSTDSSLCLPSVNDERGRPARNWC